jgi:hypothetical protein
MSAGTKRGLTRPGGSWADELERVDSDDAPAC